MIKISTTKKYVNVEVNFKLLLDIVLEVDLEVHLEVDSDIDLDVHLEVPEHLPSEGRKTVCCLSKHRFLTSPEVSEHDLC